MQQLSLLKDYKCADKNIADAFNSLKQHSQNYASDSPVDHRQEFGGLISYLFKNILLIVSADKIYNILHLYRHEGSSTLKMLNYTLDTKLLQHKYMLARRLSYQ